MTVVTAISNRYDNLLSRMEGVQSTSSGHRARCPACGGKSRKLRLAQGDDGRVLLHCFGGCSATGVLAALGLTVSDLFEKSITSNVTSAEKRALRERQRQSQWRAALDVLVFEATVVLMAVTQLCSDEPLSRSDFERLKQAVERVADARETLND